MRCGSRDEEIKEGECWHVARKHPTILPSIHPSIQPSNHLSIHLFFIIFHFELRCLLAIKGWRQGGIQPSVLPDNWQALVTLACFWTHTRRTCKLYTERTLGWSQSYTPVHKNTKSLGPNKTFSRICLYFLKYFWPHLTTLPEGRQPSLLQQCLSLAEPFLLACIRFSPLTLLQPAGVSPDCPAREEMLIGYLSCR